MLLSITMVGVVHSKTFLVCVTLDFFLNFLVFNFRPLRCAKRNSVFLLIRLSGDLLMKLALRY